MSDTLRGDLKKNIIKEQWFSTHTKAVEEQREFPACLSLWKPVETVGRGKRFLSTNAPSQACVVSVNSGVRSLGGSLQVWGGYDSEHKSVSVEKSLGTLHFFDSSHPVRFSVTHAFPHPTVLTLPSQSPLRLLPNPEASESHLPKQVNSSRSASLCFLTGPLYPEDTHGNSWCQARCLHVRGEALLLRLLPPS